MSFSGDVAGIAAEFSGNADEAKARDYLLDPERAGEAQQVERLVERFIDYELDPLADGPGSELGAVLIQQRGVHRAQAGISVVSGGQSSVNSMNQPKKSVRGLTHTDLDRSGGWNIC